MKPHLKENEDVNRTSAKLSFIKDSESREDEFEMNDLIRNDANVNNCDVNEESSSLVTHENEQNAIDSVANSNSSKNGHVEIVMDLENGESGVPSPLNVDVVIDLNPGEDEIKKCDSVDNC